MSYPITDIDEARRELSEVFQDVALDQGEERAEAGYSDLVDVVADRCDEPTAAELRRIERGW